MRVMMLLTHFPWWAVRCYSNSSPTVNKAMAFGVPECDYICTLNMFRVRKVIGKKFSSGGFGMIPPIDDVSPQQVVNGGEGTNRNVNANDDDDATSSTTSSKPRSAEHLFI
jgi:hypothetical protein